MSRIQWHNTPHKFLSTIHTLHQLLPHSPLPKRGLTTSLEAMLWAAWQKQGNNFNFLNNLKFTKKYKYCTEKFIPESFEDRSLPCCAITLKYVHMHFLQTRTFATLPQRQHWNQEVDADIVPPTHSQVPLQQFLDCHELGTFEDYRSVIL